MAANESGKKRAGTGSFFFDTPLNVRELAVHFAIENTRTPTLVSPHMQRCYEFILFMSGKIVCSIDGKEHSPAPGDLIVLHPGQMHEIDIPEQNDLHYFSIGISASEIDENHPIAGALVGLQALDEPICKSDGELYPLMCQALYEIRDKGTFFSEMLYSLIIQIVICSYRAFYSKGERQSESAQNSTSQDVVFWIINHINANLFDIKNATELSDAIGYSYSYLSHAFSQIMGMSIRDYIMRCKIETAKELLGSSTLSITQIAETLRYQTIHSFSKSFKKVVGMSPMDYVRENNLREG